MTSGSDLFLDLLNNLAVFIVLVALYGYLQRFLQKLSSSARQLLLGVFFGAIAIFCMHVKIRVATGVIVDQRNAIIALSGIFGGPITAVAAAILAAGYRLYLGGSGAVAGMIGVSLAAAAGSLMHVLRPARIRAYHTIIAALGCTIIIMPGFLFIGDFQAGVQLMLRMTVPYGAAIFAGILFVGLLLLREENRFATELSLKESEERFRQIFESLVDISYRTDAEGRITVMSPSVEALFGFRVDELIGHKISDYYRDPTERDRFIALLMKDGRVENFEAEMQRKDGSYAWVSTNARAIRDAKGVFVGVEGANRDITAQKKAEAEKTFLEEALQQERRLESLGQLAGGIAHDFNNVLGAIVGYSELLYIDKSTGGKVKEYTQQILLAAERAEHLIKQILLFSRRTESDQTVMMVRPLLDEVVTMLRASLPASVEIVTDFGKDTAPILADATKFHEVVMNLCTNAAYAMEKKGRLKILLREEVVSAPRTGELGEIAPGQYSVVTITDTGCGMTEEVRARIFEPFYTTKPVNEGTGMGLAVVFGILQSHNGNLSVESEVGKGSSFQVFLPKTHLPLNSESRTSISPPGGSERILVVDDEENLTEIIFKMLHGLGYNVDVFSDSRLALSQFRSNPKNYDLVMTDLAMPGLDGIDFARAIRAERKDMPIIVCTGFASDQQEKAFRGMGIDSICTKPFRRIEIAKEIRKLLDS